MNRCPLINRARTYVARSRGMRIALRAESAPLRAALASGELDRLRDAQEVRAALDWSGIGRDTAREVAGAFADARTLARLGACNVEVLAAYAHAESVSRAVAGAYAQARIERAHREDVHRENHPRGEAVWRRPRAVYCAVVPLSLASAGAIERDLREAPPQAVSDVLTNCTGMAPHDADRKAPAVHRALKRREARIRKSNERARERAEAERSERTRSARNAHRARLATRDSAISARRETRDALALVLRLRERRFAVKLPA